ncbi:hypothetical protein PIB30_086623 [Stylosanthes scabra]|uniref:Uncharacterized protein n=1 Tax=Stylosanthes scabra TaxID=79078 RepID=A0ABU6WRJ4_9FABA|nr:hypothetical protein [Stylosanthes scabra]
MTEGAVFVLCNETTNPNTTNPFSILCHPYAAAVLFSVTASHRQGSLEDPQHPPSVDVVLGNDGVESTANIKHPPPLSSIPGTLAVTQPLPPPRLCLPRLAKSEP